MHAQFIENFELREWVKKSLRKTIFLKAHELATQTGCEVLLKIRDEVDQAGSLYYATDTLQKEYSDKGLLKGPNEMCVSGETGMPMYPRVDTATQSVQCGQQQEGAGNIDSSTPEQDTSTCSIPLHLTVSNAGLQQTEDSSSQEATPVDQSIVKLEVIEEPEAEMETSLTVSDMIGDQTIEQAADETLASFGIPVNVSSLSTMPGGFPVASSSPKLYQCAVCQKAFRSVQVLQKHTQTFHIKTTQMSAMSRMKGRGPSMRPASAGRPLAQKRYTCTLCNRSFPFVALYNDHMNRSHMMSSTQYPQETQIVEQFDTSNNDNANMDTSGEGTSSAPQMPTISQVMSLQPSVLLQSPPAASSSHVPFTLAGPSTPVFTHTPGPSTSGAGMSPHQRAGTNRSTPSSRFSISNIARNRISVPITDGKTDISLRAIPHMPKDNQGQVTLWEQQPNNLNDYRCNFPSCNYMVTGIKEMRLHASVEHGAAVVFCLWCKGRKTFLRPHNFQGHVKQLHPSMRNFVHGDMLEQFAVVPELWPRSRKYAHIEDEGLRELIRTWWIIENHRRKHHGLIEMKLHS